MEASCNGCGAKRDLGYIEVLRIAVDWLLRSDIGEVIKMIVDAEEFPD